MNNNTLNVGVVGCGHLGSIHCKLLKQISERDKRVSFAGIYDINREVAKKISSKYNLNEFSTLDGLLGVINTLIIVTPTSTHFDIAECALKKRVNIFIEKPVTQKLEQAISLIKTAQGSEVKIQIGHVERFNPALISLQNYELKPRFIEVHRLAQFNPRGTDVSVIHDLMIHDIDIILSLVKSSIEKVDANGVAVISDTVDIANARLTFENGCVANLTSSRISLKKMRKMRIFQPNAYISLDFLNNKTEVFILENSDTKERGARVFTLNGDKKIVYKEPKIPNAEYEYNPIKVELESFFKSILENEPVKVTIEEGKRALEVSERIFKIISNHAEK